MSVIDELFNQLYGYVPPKKGASYEMLSAAVLKLLDETHVVVHDDHLRGKISDCLYQIDVKCQEGEGALVGEAKDYTERGSKVGRPDLQKFAGALVELGQPGALFFSATDFTREAAKYAKASSDIVGTPIDLVDLRPSTEQDRKGRIEEIHLTITMGVPLYDSIEISPVFTTEGAAAMKELQSKLEDGSIRIRFNILYDANGREMYELSAMLQTGDSPTPDDAMHASLWTPHGHLLIGNKLIALRGITYTVPWLWFHCVSVSTASGTPKLLVRFRSGSVDKLITDEQLRSVKFGDGGEVVLSEEAQDA